MTAENAITELLATPLSPDWTIEGLAEQLLCTIASMPMDDAEAFRLDAEATTDRQTQRIVRPLLACLATRSAAEAGTPPSLYGGRLCFKRTGPAGPVWVLVEFENTPGSVRAAFWRSASPSEISEETNGEASVPADTGFRAAT